MSEWRVPTPEEKVAEMPHPFDPYIGLGPSLRNMMVGAHEATFALRRQARIWAPDDYRSQRYLDELEAFHQAVLRMIEASEEKWGP